MPIRVWNKTNNAATFFGPHSGSTSQFAPPTAGEASVWLQDDVDVISASQAVASALGVGNSRALTFRNNITQTGSTVTLSHPDLNVRALVGGTLVEAVDTAQSSSNIARQLDGGTPPSEASRIGFFYLDVTDENLSIMGFGSPTQNQSVSTTPEYMGIDQNRTTTTETVARSIIPVACHLKKMRCRYVGTDGTTHELALMIDGVATVIGSLTGSAATLNDFILDIAIPAMSRIDFRIVRTAGTGTNMILLGVCGFTPDEP